MNRSDKDKATGMATFVNPFPHDKILYQTKLKAFADERLNVTKKIISVFDRVENTVGKGEIAFHTMFSKCFFPRCVKGVIVWEWLKIFSQMVLYVTMHNPFPNKTWFLRVCSTSLLKTQQEKEKIARNEQFLLFQQCFPPVWGNFCHFPRIQNCRLQTLSVLEGSKIYRLGKG